MADKLLKSIKFPTLPDRYVIGDTTLTEEGAAADAKAVGGALAKKADTKGRYEDIVAGGAEQLMADGHESDSEPYLFRPTGGSADVGNREYLDKIVGGTVAWNQLVNPSAFATETLNGVTFTNNGDGTWTVNGTATEHTAKRVVLTQVNKNDKILYKGCPSGGSPSTYHFQDDYGNGKMDFYSSSGYIALALNVEAGVTVSNLKFTPNYFNLTKMFNPTIADYIYSLEQAQAGAGVAWFRNYFPKDYYPYDPGTLRSVEGVSAHETVGFNQWDEEWENGWINASGDNIDSVNEIRSKNYIPVIPNTSYYFNVPDNTDIHYFDANKHSLGLHDKNGKGDIAYNSTDNQIRVTPDDCCYIRFWVYRTSTYNHDICINLSDPSRNGEYEPYAKHTYPLDSSLTLRGVPKLVDGKLAYDGDVYPPDGTVTRKYGIVDLGTLNWMYWQAQSLFYVEIPTKAQGTNNFITSKYPTLQSGGYGELTDKQIIGSQANSYIYVKDSSYTDAASFKAAMSGVMLVYELATPTTETADGYEHYQICDPSGTEEFVTTGIVPVGHETRYPHDLKKKIETAPDSPSTDGTYLMKRSGGKNTYMALPSTPSANGSYVLTVTVSGGTASYSWTAKG